ncbi:MAG: hypothetical protein QOI10_295 [Solirubrobacterales bacterium]|jgi:hypothetical protein|nr:hypothetical protein [Solirubrobacterales bacterium]
MHARRIAVLILALVAGAASAAVAEGHGELKGERTHPQIQPANGHRHTPFTLTFTLRETPGHQGVYAVDYRVEITPPRTASASCMPDQPPIIETGTAGATQQVPLTPPARGWCRGSHRVTVFLERGPYCPPPVEGQTPTPCPLFASQELDTGHAVFTVAKRH